MRLAAFFHTTVGQKFIVAFTGAFMVVFLLVHLGGNLQIFSGPEAVNHYGVFLRSFPVTLWSLRIALILSVVLHIWLTISLTRRNRQSRPQDYQVKVSRQASGASKTMMLSGLTVLAFVFYHLAHYTFGIADPGLMELFDHQGRPHVYNMMVMGFSHPLVAGFYIVAQVLLAYHLSHGISSAARTFGVSEPSFFYRIRKAGQIFAGVIAIAYICIPLAVILGLVPLDV